MAKLNEVTIPIRFVPAMSPIEADVDQLMQSGNGREALRLLDQWVCRGSCCNLDALNVMAVSRLLYAAWNGQAGSVIDAVSAVSLRVKEA